MNTPADTRHGRPAWARELDARHSQPAPIVQAEHQVAKVSSVTALFSPMAHRRPIHIDDPVAPAWLFRTRDRQLAIAVWYGSAGWSVWYIEPDSTYESICVPA